MKVRCEKKNGMNDKRLISFMIISQLGANLIFIVSFNNIMEDVNSNRILYGINMRVHCIYIHLRMMGISSLQ